MPVRCNETSSRNLFGAQGLMYGRWAKSLEIGDRPLLLVAWDPHDIADEFTVPYATTRGARCRRGISRAMAWKYAISTIGSCKAIENRRGTTESLKGAQRATI